MLPFVAGLQKKLNDIISKLNSDLDVQVSTRAPSSSALSNTVWTNAKAAYLDASILAGYPLELHTVTLSSGTWNKPSDMIGDIVYLTGCGGGGGGGYSSSTAYDASGGSGAVSAILLPYLMDTSSVSVAIGAGGSGGTSSSGANGGNTIFGDIVLFGGTGGFYPGSTASTYYSYPPLASLSVTDSPNYRSTTKPTSYDSDAHIIDGGYGGPYHVDGGRTKIGNYSGGTNSGGGASVFGAGGSLSANGSGYGSGGGGGNGTAGGDGTSGFLKVSYFRKVTS